MLAVAAAVVVLVAGLGWTARAADAEGDAASREDNQRLARRADVIADEFADTIGDDLNLLAAAAAFQAANQHDLEPFRTFVAGLPLNQHPGFTYVSYIVPVSPAGVSELERTRRASGQPGFAVDRGPLDGRFHVVLFSGPTEERTDGVDLGQVDLLAATLERAGDAGVASVTPPFVRIQDRSLPAAEQQLSIGLYVPVYEPGAGTATVQQRRSALLGWTATAVPLPALLAQLPAVATGDVRVSVRHADQPDDEAGAFPAPAAPAGAARWSTSVDVGGQRWLLDVVALDTFPSASDSGGTIAVAGFLASVAGALLVLLLGLRRRDPAGAATSVAADAAAREARFEALVRHSTDLITVIGPDRLITYASPAVAELFGVGPDAAVGTDPLLPVHPDDREAVIRVIDAAMSAPGVQGPVRYRVTMRDGRERWIEATATNLLDDPDVGGVVAICRDVTAQQDAADALRERAYRDPLTGLATRDVLLEQLGTALRRAAADGQPPVGVLFVDLDRFKQVNDRFGHAAGDVLLVEVARAIEGAVRPGDMVARHGGDEFVVLLETVRGEREARAVADRVRSAVRRPVVVADGVVLEAAASVGVTMSDGGATAEAMLRDADAALYRAKEAGRDRVELFDEDLRRRAMRRLDMELVLRQALEDETVDLRFEAVADVVDGRIVGAEGRISLALPSGDPIPYVELLRVAQEVGLARELTARSLEVACRAVVSWADDPDAPRWVGIDVSAGEVTHPGFISELTDILGRTGVASGALRLELPVEVITQGSSLTRRAISAVQALGVSVVLDGVGAELRSLATVGSFAVDGLKLDLDALPDAVTDPVAAAVAASVGEVAAAAGLPVVVVGANDHARLDVVRRLGFRFVQGEAVAALSPLLLAGRHGEGRAR